MEGMVRLLVIAYLYAEWLSAHFRIKTLPPYKEFQKLIDMYSDNGRHYHGLKHIADCLKFIRLHFNDVADICCVQFAIFYHDCVYDVTRADNEEQSAEHWLNYASSLEMTSRFKMMVKEMILSTKGHDVSSTSSLLFKIMNDADMHIFLSSTEDYLEYAKNIWREYKRFGREKYIEGRLKFLSTVDPADLFYTDIAEKQIHAAVCNVDLERTMLLSCPDQILVD